MASILETPDRFLGTERQIPAGTHEFNRGIYMTGTRTVETADEPLVVVHPFYIEKAVYGGCKTVPTPDIYLPKLEKLVATYEGPIITLEESPTIKKTAKRYLHANRTNDSYFIKTRYADPVPAEILLADLVEFLKSFKPQKLKLAGGFLHNQSVPGCLGAMADYLAGQGFWTRILEDCTFSYLP